MTSTSRTTADVELDISMKNAAGRASGGRGVGRGGGRGGVGGRGEQQQLRTDDQNNKTSRTSRTDAGATQVTLGAAARDLRTETAAALRTSRIARASPGSASQGPTPALPLISPRLTPPKGQPPNVVSI